MRSLEVKLGFIGALVFVVAYAIVRALGFRIPAPLVSSMIRSSAHIKKNMLTAYHMYM
jgi:hypothetical protein